MAGSMKAGDFPFPENVTIDILTRLPVKSIGCLLCVSKQLKVLISDPFFLKTHLKRNHSPVHRLILWSKSLYTLKPSQAQVSKVDFQGMDESEWYRVVGSCNGLLLVFASGSEACILLNPTTKESKKLPDSPFVVDEDRFSQESVYGFGFDSSTDDYKVVKIISYGRDDDFHSNVVSVYSLKRNSWKRIPDAPYDFSKTLMLPGTFCNGAVHWLVMGFWDSDSDGKMVAKPPTEDLLDSEAPEGFIASLDLANEEFYNMQIPGFSHVDEEDIRTCELGVLAGRLFLAISQYDGSYLDVYLTKTHEVMEPWDQFSIHIPHWHLKPLGFSRKDRVLIMVNGESLFLYNTEDHECNKLVIQGISGNFEARTFMESLVSPNCYILGEMERTVQEASSNSKKRKK